MKARQIIVPTLAAMLGSFMATCSMQTNVTTMPEPWTEGGMQTGRYRNLFVELGYPADQVEKKVQEVFDSLFFGSNHIYFEVGDSMAYISDIKNNDVRTEGMSYGLMIAVQMDRRDIFDRLWRWTRTYMEVKEGDSPWATNVGYMAWSCGTDGKRNAHGPASDGELYYITSLLFASNRWGNDGPINYLADAQHLLEVIQPKTVEFQIPGREKRQRTIALMDPETKLISFVPGMPFTDPSYHLPVFYEIWAKYGQDGREDYWKECARVSREYLHRSINPQTGLNPDYNNFDGTLLNNGHIIGDAFRFDSWRVPMNIALDYSWACADREWQHNYGHTIQNFLYGQGIDAFVDQYNVDGTLPSDTLGAGGYKTLRHSVGLVATAAAVSLVCSHDKSVEFVDRLWNSKHEPYADGYFDAYYDGLLRLFAFMHLSGKYRVIEPAR